MDEMTCEQWRDLLPWYAADHLSDGQRAATERHLASCGACQRELAQWRAIRAALHTEDMRVPVDATADEGWAAVRVHLPSHSAKALHGLHAWFAKGSVRMDHDHPTVLDGPTSQDARPTPGPAASAPAPIPQRRHALPAVAATLLVVALGGALFAMLGSQRDNQPGSEHFHTATATPATACTPDKVTTDLLQHAIIAQLVMLSAGDGWIVGSVGDTAGNTSTLILHYSHCQWRSAGVSFAGFTLSDIAMASPSEGWASGTEDSSGTKTLILHYAGGRWQPIPTPTDPPEASATGQLITHSGREGWVIVQHPKNALGKVTSTVYHYQNGVWSPVATPMPEAYEVAKAGSDDAWFVGDNSGWPTVLAHYQQGHWTTIALPNGWSASNLIMSSPRDGWAVGSFADPTNTRAVVQTFLLHFDGTTWSRVDLPANIHAASVHVQLISASDRWAFTLTSPYQNPQGTPLTTAVWHYVGGQWQPVQWPFTDVLGVNDLTRISDNEYWAIAFVVVPTPRTADILRVRGVLLHYLNGSWTEYG
jgi:Putative zinc-finger